jgi:hypothetical protein
MAPTKDQPEQASTEQRLDCMRATNAVVEEAMESGGAGAEGLICSCCFGNYTSIFFKFTSFPLPKSSTAAAAAGTWSTVAGLEAVAAGVRAAALGGGALDALEGKLLAAAAAFEGLGAAAGDLAVKT